MQVRDGYDDASIARSDAFDIVCLSHLRWGFVFQRPHHLLTRFGRERRVFFVEEPKFDADAPRLEVHHVAAGVEVAVPHLPPGTSDGDAEAEQRRLLDDLLEARGCARFVLWYYSPMAVAWTRHLRPIATVYDCMDELSAFADAPRTLADREGELLDSADLVFTGGMSLFEAKDGLHPHVHAFPSGVDVPHFARARDPGEEPSDQRAVPHPRVGFFGVIDERLDIDLLARAASLRPDLHLVMLGPVAKIDPASLPRAANLHYLGAKSYEELPDYVRGWEVAMLPFAMNEATRFISPTKTPEYLAAGRPVVSTPVRDVVQPYGERDLVEIASDAEAFVAAIDRARARDLDALRRDADAVLATMSWDTTWTRMRDLILAAIDRNVTASAVPRRARETVVDLPEARVAVADAMRSPVTDGVRDGNGVRADGDRAPSDAAIAVPSRLAGFDWLIVGAGFAGSVHAARLASQTDARVLVVEKRNPIGGNAYDHYDDDGLLIHRYGPHVFHTNAKHVFDYLSRFTAWRPYEHRVLASVDGRLLPIPINLDTINAVCGVSLTEPEVEALLATLAEPVDQVRTSEDVVVSQDGRYLYEKFFRGYTR